MGISKFDNYLQYNTVFLLMKIAVHEFMFCRFFCSKSRELNLKMEITYEAMMDVCIIRDHLRR